MCIRDRVLSNINFKINKGEVVAIVGPSGAGKSTIADLIPRFYDPKDGEILIDQENIKKLSLASLRKNMGIVTQDVILFNDTIKNNIAYAQPKATMESIINACKAANALEFIEEIPEGFDAIIGERGVKLSGGQKQRLSNSSSGGVRLPGLRLQLCVIVLRAPSQNESQR